MFKMISFPLKRRPLFILSLWIIWILAQGKFVLYQVKKLQITIKGFFFEVDVSFWVGNTENSSRIKLLPYYIYARTWKQETRYHLHGHCGTWYKPKLTNAEKLLPQDLERVCLISCHHVLRSYKLISYMCP